MGRPRLMFVDDDRDIVQAFERTFRRDRSVWDMVFATNGVEALAEMRIATCDLVVSDLRMPEMDGAELLGVLKREFPKTLRCVLSGDAESDLRERAWPIAHVMLTKPCDNFTLRTTITRLLTLGG
jgi:CheY-like chemotaxis protein